MNYLEPVDFAEQRDDLAAGQTLNAAQLGIIIVYYAPAQQGGIGAKDFNHISGVKAAFDPFNADRKEAVAAVEQRFDRSFIHI
ncbi:hypothetical protein D3C72_2258960 [compost metagenome]